MRCAAAIYDEGLLSSRDEAMAEAAFMAGSDGLFAGDLMHVVKSQGKEVLWLDMKSTFPLKQQPQGVHPSYCRDIPC